MVDFHDICLIFQFHYHSGGKQNCIFDKQYAEDPLQIPALDCQNQGTVSMPPLTKFQNDVSNLARTTLKAVVSKDTL